MRDIIGIIIGVLSVIGGIYVGGWLMFVQPIIGACQHFDAGTLTGVIVGITIIKCVFASVVGTLIAYIGVFIGGLIADIY